MTVAYILTFGKKEKVKVKLKFTLTADFSRGHNKILFFF